MRFFKILFSILILFILICVLAIGCLIYFFDPNPMKPFIIDEVKKVTGYQLQIDGKLSWTFYPRLAIKAEHMLLTAPHQSMPLVDAYDIRMGTDVVALLHSREQLLGNVFISSIKTMGIKAEKISTNVHWQNNVLTLSSLEATLYEGKLEGLVIGENLSSIPHWKWNFQVKDIQVKPLLIDANGSDSKIKINGIGEFKVQAEAQGKTREQILRGLNGTSIFSLKKGWLEGIDINYFIKAAEALLNKDKESIDLPVDSKQTAFDSLTGSAYIKNGVVYTEDTSLIAPSFTTKAEGNVVLISSALDLELEVKPVLENSKKQWIIPILITGDLRHPDVRLNMMQIQKLLAGMQIEKIKEEAVKQIKKHVHGKTGELLQRLLGD